MIKSYIYIQKKLRTEIFRIRTVDIWVFNIFDNYENAIYLFANDIRKSFQQLRCKKQDLPQRHKATK